MAGQLNTPTGAGSAESSQPAAEQRPQFVGSATGQPLSPPAAEEPQAGGDGGEPPSAATKTATTDPPEAPEGTGTGDAPVVGHGGKEMSAEAISDRIARDRKKFLRENFGTDEESKVKEIIARGKKSNDLPSDDQKELERLRRVESSRQRARLTRQQRVEQDIKDRDARIAELEQTIQTKAQDEAVATQDMAIASAASEYIEPTYMKYANRDLAEHLTELQKTNPDAFAKFGNRQLQRFFQKYAAERPAFAKQTNSSSVPASTETPATPPKKAPVKRQVTTTRSAARPPAASPADAPGTYKGKVVKPGQPNSMTKQELREWAKSTGQKITY